MESAKQIKMNKAGFLGLSGLTKFMADPVSFIQSYADQGPEIQSCQMGPKNFVFVFSPEAAQEILVKRAATYVQNRTIFDRIQPVTGKKGLVQLAGRESQEARAKTRPMFTKNPMEEARELIQKFTLELLEKMGSSAVLDVTATMTDLILRTALRIFLGIDSESMVAAIGPKFLRLNHLCGLRMRSLLPLPLAIPTQTNSEIRSLEREIRSLLNQHVAEHTSLQEVRQNTVPEVFAGDAAMIDHCMTFLFAGHETTAASLAFTLLLLAQNPAYQGAIAAGDSDITLAVYKESLRLYPPAYMLAREAVADDELLGFQVKKSDQVFIGISSMHRNEKFFEHPNEFYPERFLEKLKHPFAFIPFGAGGKSCVGERLAYLEATVILKMICEKYRILPMSEQILIEPMITLHPPTGQKIRLEPRAGQRHRMTNADFNPQIDSLIATYLESNSLRPEILFRHFLPRGYRQTTLDSVAPHLLAAVIYAKVHLGMIITLYDDFADHPNYRNPALLQHLYQLNVGVDRRAPASLSGFDLKNYELARFLFTSLTTVLKTFPHVETLIPVLRFDIEQFYSSNRHSELMTSLPSIRNLTESRIMGPHNMGIMAAGTIDLMASPDMDLMELGVCREIFHLGQRMGRTSNIIFTLLREITEGDATNEILISAQTKKADEATYKLQLLREFSVHVEEISKQQVQSFNPVRYAKGFESLHQLQGSLAGKI